VTERFKVACVQTNSGREIAPNLAAVAPLVRAARDAVARGRSVLIFPEGTRTTPGERRPFHPGVAAMYGQLGVPAVPVALNSGVCWGRRRFIKRPARIIVEFLPPIPPGLPRARFMAEIQSRIHEASDRLVACALVDRSVDNPGSGVGLAG
jgi:1-acyl-sn-glycerol-3-phosphate acyltransferase